MLLAPNFTLQELTHSATALQRGLDNTPGERELRNLRHLAFWLQLLRDDLGEPVRVSSGFRTAEVNYAVGGSPSSDHMTGLAADIWADSMTPSRLAGRIQALEYLPFDQLILYPAHLHVGIGPRLRGQVFAA